MRTLIISDLHLGASTGVDVLRSELLRATLWQALERADRLVLLGDTLELRHGGRRDALAAARPFFEQLGGRMAGREVVLVPGNHDHALIRPWLERRGETDGSARLGLEQRLSVDEASPMASRLAAWAHGARLTVAYPGLWVREDVYATHGHYLDCHLAIPTLERLGIAATGRVLRLDESSLAGVEDYEALAAPVYAWIDAVAQLAPSGSALNGQGTVRAWRVLQGLHDRPTLGRRLRSRALAGGFMLGVAALNRAGIGRFQSDISGSELRRSALRAMAEVSRRLGLEGSHLVFGHTHRAGPLAHENEPLWRTASGVRLINCGSWTYEPQLLGATVAESPYWPGGCVTVEDGAPPTFRALLEQLGCDELQSALAG
ncbi:MAG TPA: metallophosphoesterase [Solirubrobacteraceae bacterium]|jgi:hypothetical protein